MMIVRNLDRINHTMAKRKKDQGSSLPENLHEMARSNFEEIKKQGERLPQSTPVADTNSKLFVQNKLRLMSDRESHGQPILAPGKPHSERPNPLDNPEAFRQSFVYYVPAARSIWDKGKRKGRFYSKAKSTDDCWLSRGGKSTEGSPRYARRGMQEVPLSHLAYLLNNQSMTRSEMPKRLYHKCGNKECVNPAHLGKRRNLSSLCDNEDKRKNNGQHNREKFQCKNGHHLSGDNVYYQRCGNGKFKRSCVRCRKEGQANRRNLQQAKRQILSFGV